MKLKILNDRELDNWLNERRIMGHDVYSIKGPAPEGATYEDGELIERDVNVAWRDIATDEVFEIVYATD